MYHNVIHSQERTAVPRLSTRKLWPTFEVEIRSHLGIRMRLRAVLSPGWCVMHGRLLSVGMAATPEQQQTCFAHFAALVFPAAGC
jgi:hypothetical protein